MRIEGKTSASIQSALWSRLLSLPVAFHRRYTVADLGLRAMGIEEIRRTLAGSVAVTLVGAVFQVMGFALLFYYHWRLALVAACLVGLIVAVELVLGPLRLRAQRRVAELAAHTSSLVLQMVSSIAKLRVAGVERRAFAEWARRFSEQRSHAFRAGKVANLGDAFDAFFAVLAMLVLFFALGELSPEHPLAVGQFLGFNAAFGQVLAATMALLGVLRTTLQMVPVYERVRPIIEAAPETTGDRRDPGELSGEVEFSHVSFRYAAGGSLILDDVSFRAGAGEFVALVGPSASGKSTTLRLLLGFETPESGSIYFDGQDLASIDIEVVRRQYGIVLQGSQLTAGGILANIIGSRPLSTDEAWDAARLVGLDDDIRKMPMGMHTVVTDGASTFSGGQKQRLLLARAIVARPRVLLLDEATSALDNRTQAIVRRSLQALHATRIVIAHRLSTIRDADRIFVLERGKMVQSGRYEELVRERGPFAELVRRQTG